MRNRDRNGDDGDDVILDDWELFPPKVVDIRNHSRSEGNVLNAHVYMPHYRPSARTGEIVQHAFIVRAVWFVLIGWWATAVWLSLAYFFAILIFTLPLAHRMFDYTNTVLTLQR